jgi:hypothetical protein
MDVSGKFESATMRSSRYNLEDIQALSGVAYNGVVKILSDLAMMEVVTRRPGPAPPDVVVNAYNEAQKFLTDLADGIAILSFAETQQAGQPRVYFMTPQDYIEDRYITSIWPRAWGVREKDRPRF